ncbi:jmjc domain-containing protein 7 [Zymoseptoria brevis]|uniref:Jmjc domain-containing protein 7 n=1 Tax=Zymoseptoria brevis TaxID=1047168 RepID=A0A0F4G9U7_9PEZI|nr:jmjc domain-containing protein 7 [Zymoseptoria brevis]
MDSASSGDPIATLIETYHELNLSIVQELSDEPSPLEFMRYVARNRPFVVRNAAKDWPAVRKWDTKYLSRVLHRQDVRVAVTPKGNADAVVSDQKIGLLFAEPHEIVEPFEDFLSYVQEDSSPSSDTTINVKYAQPQNDSLRTEYSSLFTDVPPTIPFATIALEQDPDAVNFWLGNSRSTTSIHKDNYENIYVQIRGQKHFTLLPPIEMACVNETPLPFGRYHPDPENGAQLEARINADDEELRPVPIWDPDKPDVRSTRYSKLSRPLRVTLNEGDMMYLPALWYHKVGQGNGEEGFACSVNYWYDMEFGGGFWASNAFVRDVVGRKEVEVKYPEMVIGEEDDEAEAK